MTTTLLHLHKEIWGGLLLFDSIDYELFAYHQAVLMTFALIVSVYPYCARNSRHDVMPRHALSVSAVEEI